MKICPVFRRKCYVMSYRQHLAKVHKSSWDHKAEEQALLRACIYVRKHFRRGFSTFSVAPMKRRATEEQRVSLVPGESPEVRGKRFLSVARCLISRYTYTCGVFTWTCFPRKSRLISRVSPSGDPRGRNPHLPLVARLVNAIVLSPCHNQRRKCEKIKCKRDDL